MTASIPGAGQLTDEEQVLAARVQGFVTIEPDTVMVKVLPSATVTRYLSNEISPGAWGEKPPFDYRMVGGTVARQQDLVNLRTPIEFFRAFRLDYPGSPFAPSQPVLHVLEFSAVDPAQFVTPLGAPGAPTPESGPYTGSAEVREVAFRMVDAAQEAGLDPNTFRMEIAPWPYTGTGVTADPQFGVPERWKRLSVLPSAATIFEYNTAGAKTPLAIFRGQGLGWERLR
ncbi:hypothetical protein SAMN05421504_11561 [Amycolatopsis xylanica]|uniref:Uncharacterized protein n=1 Tax=Amycolatopsis xylanica TaxID=589385 RepID=A0A1H3SU35_9PSEU|nr:hypothetical protein [Amycolatopsis xylanica]SDZ40649.1 hypothetical protein SAMN05421504_11561 [Amycolatopsis xylanica]